MTPNICNANIDSFYVEAGYFYTLAFYIFRSAVKFCLHNWVIHYTRFSSPLWSYPKIVYNLFCLHYDEHMLIVFTSLSVCLTVTFIWNIKNFTKKYISLLFHQWCQSGWSSTFVHSNKINFQYHKNIVICHFYSFVFVWKHLVVSADNSRFRLQLRLCKVAATS